MRFPQFYLQCDIRTSCWQSVLQHGYNNILKTSEMEFFFVDEATFMVITHLWFKGNKCMESHEAQNNH